MGTIVGFVERVCLGIIVAGAGWSGALGQATDKPVIQFLFPDVAPFLNSAGDDGPVHGPIAARVETLAARAGYAVQWQGPIPRTRILADLQDGRPACTPNVIETPERAARFKFTAPLFPSPHWVVVARAPADWIKPYTSVAALLRDPKHVFGSLLGASNGPVIDKIMAEESNHQRPIRGTPSDLVKMVALGHVDYILFSGAKDARDAAVAAGLDPSVITTAQFPELAKVGAGHIMCAATVDDAVITAFDQAIAETTP